MDKTIYSQALWVKEWMDLGFACANGSRYPVFDLKHKKENFNYYKKNYENLLKKAKKIKNLDTYFQSYKLENNEFLCLSDFIMKAFFNLSELSFHDLQKELIDKFTRFNINELREDTFKFIDFHRDYMECIRKLPIDNEAKLDLLECIHSPEKMINGLFDIFNQFAIIYQKNALEESAFQNIQMLKDEYLKQYFEHIGLTLNDNPISIYPTFVNYQNIILYVEDHHSVLFVGVGLEQEALIDFHEYQDGDQRLEYFLKILSDKSKFEILTLLKNKSMYGNELAKTMNLKTSTISYHMDALIQGELIYIKKENNRIYYFLNEFEIEKMIKLLHQKLLK